VTTPADAPDLIGRADVLGVDPLRDLLSVCVSGGPHAGRTWALSGRNVAGGIPGLITGDQGTLWVRRDSGSERLHFVPDGRDLFPVTPLDLPVRR
jgi:hypothetical protein